MLMTILCNGARICVRLRLRGVIVRGISSTLHGIDPCDVAWNADAIRWVDGMVYVVSRNVKRNGELGERYTVVTAEQWLDMHRVPGDESCVARLESYCESEA